MRINCLTVRPTCVSENKPLHQFYVEISLNLSEGNNPWLSRHLLLFTIIILQYNINDSLVSIVMRGGMIFPQKKEKLPFLFIVSYITAETNNCSLENYPSKIFVKERKLIGNFHHS